MEAPLEPDKVCVIERANPDTGKSEKREISLAEWGLGTSQLNGWKLVSEKEKPLPGGTVPPPEPAATPAASPTKPAVPTATHGARSSRDY